MEEFDVIVIGGGTAGVAAAQSAGETGARVALVESNRLGGHSLFKGQLPLQIMNDRMETSDEQIPFESLDNIGIMPRLLDDKVFRYRVNSIRRGGRVAEGAPLLREYTLIGIEGSNPSLSAILFCFQSLRLPRYDSADLFRLKQSSYLSLEAGRQALGHRKMITSCCSARRWSHKT